VIDRQSAIFFSEIFGFGDAVLFFAKLRRRRRKTIFYRMTGEWFANTNYSSKADLEPCVPTYWYKALNMTLAGVGLIIGIYSVRELSNISGDEDPEIKREKMRILGASVSTIGILLWPVAWDLLVGYTLISYQPLILFGFAWPMVMSLLDLVYSSNAKTASQAKQVFGIGEITSDANTLVGIAFAVGSLLGSQGNKQLSTATIPLLLIALFLLIAFIVPTPSLDPNDYSGYTVGAIQRTFFNYAMGMVVTGITINLSSQNKRNLQRSFDSFCAEQF
jgi:hypothetical protein